LSRKLAVVFALIAVLIFSFRTFAQNVPENTPILVAVGTVDQVDSVGSTLVIMVVDQEMLFVVPDDVKIRRGSDEIFLDDIEQGDNITVEYYRTSDGQLKATSITDTNLINEF